MVVGAVLEKIGLQLPTGFNVVVIINSVVVSVAPAAGL